MKVLYCSCLPDTVFKNLVSSGINISQAAQKFNKLIIKGFCANGYDVDVLRVLKNNFDISAYSETYFNKSVKFHFITNSYSKIKRYLAIKKHLKQFIKDWKAQNPNGVFFVDLLSSYAFIAIKFASKYNLKTITVITDFVEKPDFKISLSYFKSYILYRNFFSSKKHIDGYVFLTKYMEEKFKNKKYIVLEGLVDDDIIENSQQTQKEKNCVYTGILSKKYGLNRLVDAFCSPELSNYKLILYGKGDYLDEIKQISKEHANILYGGYLPNEEIQSIQSKAYLLANPRPTSGEYTKYSFPSKTVEYMLSGTPVVTTKLIGIPEEYDEYLYYFNSDSYEDVKSMIVHLFNLPQQTIAKKGLQAKEFVVQNKNYKKQVKKIISMINEI